MSVIVFVENVNFDLIENHKFEKFYNFRIKIIPNADYFSLVLKKTFSSLMSREKRNIFTLYLLITVNLFKNRKLPEIAEDHNLGTEYDRNVKFV